MGNILVISPVPSHPQNAGNRKRVYNLLINLQKIGFKIYFIYVSMEKDGDVIKMRRRWDYFKEIKYLKPKLCWKKRTIQWLFNHLPISYVIPYGIDDWYINDITVCTLEIIKKYKFDAIIVEYVFMSKILEYIDSNLLKIIDTHDIFANRHKKFLKNNMKPSWFYTTEYQEKIGLERADVIMAIQKKESEYFAKKIKKQVITVGHMTEPFLFKHNTYSNRKKLLFVGSLSKVNYKAINYFINSIYPQLRQYIPDIQLDIVGRICDGLENVPSGCNMIGEVEDLRPYYQQADIVINPVLFGTGLKIKNIEALSYGKPLVTSSIGAEGLEEAKEIAFLVADTPESFVDSIIKIIKNKNLYRTLSENAYRFAIEYNKKCLQPLLDVLEKASKN